MYLPKTAVRSPNPHVLLQCNLIHLHQEVASVSLFPWIWKGSVTSLTWQNSEKVMLCQFQAEILISCLFQINHQVRSATTARPPNDEPKSCGQAWRVRCYLRERETETENHGETDKSRRKEPPKTEWRSYHGCGGSSPSHPRWCHEDEPSPFEPFQKL